MRFLPWFPLILQSDQVDASWRKSGPVCRLQLTDSTENLVVYYGLQTLILSSLRISNMFDIFSLFQNTYVFICHASPSNKAHVSVWVRCDRNNFKVLVVYNLQTRSVSCPSFPLSPIYIVSKCVMPSVLQICSDLKSHVVYSSLHTLKLWIWLWTSWEIPLLSPTHHHETATVTAVESFRFLGTHHLPGPLKLDNSHRHCEKGPVEVVLYLASWGSSNCHRSCWNSFYSAIIEFILCTFNNCLV